MTKRLCSINGCGQPHKGYGWCQKHYLRWKISGDPLVVSIALSPQGAPNKWLSNHVDFQSDECLIWPFAKMTNGYGLTSWKGKKNGAHRVMCELVHGMAPTLIHEAAHSCGNGNIGCVNPRHIRWATPKENTSDKRIHGTMTCGEKISWSKLTEVDVRRIKTMFEKQTDIEIAEQFGVSDAAIYLICKKKNWKHIQ